MQGSDGDFIGGFASALLGSPEIYGKSETREDDWWGQNGGAKWRGTRTPMHTINFVTAHDGFSLADAVSYNKKHNGANGEDNKDGALCRSAIPSACRSGASKVYNVAAWYTMSRLLHRLVLLSACRLLCTSDILSLPMKDAPCAQQRQACAGEQHNHSWNCGHEGPTDDPVINRLRQRQMRNFAAALMLAQVWCLHAARAQSQ